MKILISGALGFMGREVARQCQAQGVEIAAGVDVAEGSADFPLFKTFDQAPVADVIIDFSKPGSLDGLLAYAVKNRVPAVLCRLAKEAAKYFPDADIEIVEAHHNRKVDAPSGTAIMLYDAVKDAYDQPREAVYGRHGRDCKRRPNEIGIHALRGGTVTGEHEVSFFGASERIRISHSAENRSVFAVGALRAAEFLVGQAPGLYSMDDVVGRI